MLIYLFELQVWLTAVSIFITITPRLLFEVKSVLNNMIQKITRTHPSLIDKDTVIFKYLNFTIILGSYIWVLLPTINFLVIPIYAHGHLFTVIIYFGCCFRSDQDLLDKAIVLLSFILGLCRKWFYLKYSILFFPLIS